MTCLVVALGFKTEGLTSEPAHSQHLSWWLLSGGELCAPSPNDPSDLPLVASLQLRLAGVLNAWGLDGEL